MAAQAFDLNLEPPDWDLNEPIDWNNIGEWDGFAHELDYHMVMDESDEGAHQFLIIYLISVYYHFSQF